MPKHNILVREQLLYIAEHVAIYEQPHEDVYTNPDRKLWTAKTDQEETISVDFMLKPKVYIHRGKQSGPFFVPFALLKVEQMDGSYHSVSVERNNLGNARRVTKGNDIFDKDILNQFLEFPYYDEAGLLSDGLAKIRNKYEHSRV